MVAGEVSGDQLAAPAIRTIRQQRPEWRVAGVAGDSMIEAGCEPWHHVRELSVRGYVEVLKELPRLLWMRRSLTRRVLEEGCRVLVGVDSPDFNLGLEASVRAAGVPTVQFVGPSIWAWRGERIERIRRSASHVLLVFPFEQRLYARAGIAATYVGHPLAQAIALRPDPQAARARLGLSGRDTVIAVLPGSRKAEIDFIGPVFFGAADRLARDLSPVRFLVPVADPLLRARIEALIGGYPRLAPITSLIEGRSHDCLEAAHAVLVTSGTATLEAALFKRPMVISYRMPRVSAWMMRKIGGYVPWIGLPNILAGETVVPELLQDEATDAALAAALIAQLEDAPGQARLAERFEAIHESLLRDTPSLVAEVVLGIAGAPR
ncbi:MAG TPA: lipid-A-disaccharide synthase [Burkholderiaceae bacterium]|jgi:lipid-A-disaccharide synthase|nr:lipid-A-disaccharide synthase [Burkholderiaceae bacterium]